jgi:hypothetical protein
VTAIVTTGLIKGGRLDVRNRKQFEAQLRRMKDGAIQITVERVHATRSVQQGRWYWGVIVELLSDHTGFTPDEMHEVLKAKFLPKRLAVAGDNGVIVDEFVIGGSSAKLDKLQFGEYCEAIRRWAAEELNVVIPDPDAGALWPGAKPQKKGAA